MTHQLRYYIAPSALAVRIRLCDSLAEGFPGTNSGLRFVEMHRINRHLR